MANPFDIFLTSAVTIQKPDGSRSVFGMVQSFRRPDSPFERARFLLRGLDADAQYSAASVDLPGETVYSGRELLERGLPVEIGTRPGAVIIIYKRISKPRQ